ncbi:hypothetical protein [Spirosoma oryzicola]|uniref:hypothetical protein n=1 Tax=Spirosoma oryzicola TaxID=2898794 RepID=UPI001E3FFE75|nr:hypothetical protein [Spirosoma oryzicola]UHG91760.1 hypothetical protein LQ777_02410 [Spirosoma oryzicola]
MSQFAHFLRFFPLNDDTRPVPGNAITPDTAHPLLPIVPGDVLRWLIPKADLGGCPAHLSEIVLLSQANVNLGKTGIVRLQDSEHYVQFELTIDALPQPGEQFAITRTAASGEVSIMGTVRGSFANLDAYITAIQKKFEAYPHAPVLTIRRQNRLAVRMYHTSRFRPTDADLLTWRVGLGKVPANAYNTNSPALLAQSLGTVNQPATDSYKVVVADDIEAGNIFQLQGISHTATATDTPASVLTALGVGSNYLTVQSGTVVTINAQVGAYRSENRNTPTLQLLYDSNNGAGQDRYKVIIGQDVKPGNIFQVSAPGMTTKTVKAGSVDTSATIAALFNTSAGFMLIPQGQNPTATTDSGSLQVDNTNLPSIYLTDKKITQAATVTRWRLFVGSSIQRNNAFVIEQTGLTTKTVVATATDTPASIAGKLGYSTNPFTVEVPAGQTLSAYARRGPRYSEPDDIAPVRITAKPRCVRPDQAVAQAIIGNVAPGLYALGLFDKQKGKIVAQSNRLSLQRVTQETAVVRWGSLQDQERVFAYQYTEPGLTQQLRLPVWVGVMRQLTQESQYDTQRGNVIRTDLRVTYQFPLTTSMQPAAFHKALLMALKHPRLSIDNKAFRCQSDYRETEPTPVRQLYQAQADLTQLAFNSYRPGQFNELDTLSTAHVDALEGTEVFGGIWLQGNGGLWPLRVDLELQPAEYDLRVLCPHEPYRISVYVNERLATTALLTAGLLNRTERIRIEPSDRIILRAEPVAFTVDSAKNRLPAPVEPVAVVSDSPETRRTGDFNADFNTDFTINQ